jgi:putative flippase GtrA
MGLLTALFQYYSFQILWKTLELTYLLASSISFCLTVLVSFVLQKHITFRRAYQTNRKGLEGRRFILFCLNSFVGLGINAVILYVGVGVLGGMPSVVQVVSMGVLASYNFFVYRLLLG